MTPAAVGYRNIAVDTIKHEHRALSQVLELLRHLVHDIAIEHTEADFNLLSVALYYLDEFPSRLHHPKEDRFLFAAIRRHTKDFDDVLHQLEAEHASDAGAILELYRLLVQFK